MTDGRDLGSERSLLGQAALILFRYFWIIILAIVALSATALMLLYIAGHGFQSATDSMALEASGERSYVLPYAFARDGLNVARYLIAIFSLMIFFIAADPDAGGASGRSPRRAVWVLGRLIVHRIVVASVSIVYWLVSSFVLIPIFAHRPGAGTLLQLGLLVCLSIVSSYLYAKVVFYVPVCAYRAQPDSFAEAWRASHGVMRTLFATYLPLVAFSVIINLLLGGIGREWLWMLQLSELVARWSQMPLGLVTNLLPAYLGQSIAALTSLIMAGPISLAAFRVVYGRQHRIAGVFA